MTLATTTSIVTYTGNSSADTFDYDFLIPEEDMAVVSLLEIATEVETILNPAVYDITGIGDPNGGTVTYPLSGSPIASTHKINIRRIVPYTQNLQLTNQSGYLPEALEEQLDRIVMQIQQIADLVAVPFGDAMRYGGAWTPVPAFTFGSVGITGTFTGEYWEVGPWVFASYALNFTSKGSSVGNFRIDGLPVEGLFGYSVGSVVSTYSAFNGIDKPLWFYVASSSALLQTFGTNASADVTDSDLSDTTVMTGVLVYKKAE